MSKSILEEALEVMVGVDELIVKAASFRPIALKDVDGWEIQTITEGVYNLMQIRDLMYERFFKAFGDQWVQTNDRT